MRIFAFLFTFLIVPILILSVAVPLSAQEVPVAEKPSDSSDGEVEALKKKVAEQAELIEKLTKELAEAKETIKEYLEEKEPKVEPPAEQEPAKRTEAQIETTPVEGQITKVREDHKRVLIDIGSNDGLEEGDVFEVSRAGEKIGRIKVGDVVYDKWSNADVVESKVDIMSGDKIVKVLPPAQVREEPVAETRPAEKAVQKSTLPVKELPRSAAEKLAKRLEVLEGLYDDLAGQLEELQARVEGCGRTATEEVARKSMPRPEPEPELESEPEPEIAKPMGGIEAKIETVTEKFVYILAGKEDGLRVGDTFVIKRGDREIATVKVVKIIKDMCRTEITSKKTDIRKTTDIAVLR